MKNSHAIVIELALLLPLFACHSSRKTAGETIITVSTSDTLGGRQLISRSDCTTCHRFRDPSIGPSFTDISMKYALTAENVDRLSKKIISGGSGNWGNVPMTPHEGLSLDSAKTIIKSILLHKN